MSKIKIVFPNGDIFLVPSERIAENRTDYYKSKNEEDFDYHDEFFHSMQPYELIDWLANNMNWSDIKKYAIKQDQNPPDYDSLFSDAELIVIK